jgi:ethanolamine ammonia-lyase small subunit
MEFKDKVPIRGEEQNELGRADGVRPTLARIGLRRTGVSLATSEALKFAEAHALARDAVHARLAASAMVTGLRERGLDAVAVLSAAADRQEYLLRPDLGRQLNGGAADALRARPHAVEQTGGARLAVVIADGLSALAAERHALPVLDALRARLDFAQAAGWELATVVVAEQARVALGDRVAEALGADAVVVLIGERPGLSSPDSLGAYVTWRPRRETSDAERNCVSNIRAEGMGYEEAAESVAWFLTEGRRVGGTGVGLRAPESGGGVRRDLSRRRLD